MIFRNILFNNQHTLNKDQTFIPFFIIFYGARHSCVENNTRSKIYFKAVNKEHSHMNDFSITGIPIYIFAGDIQLTDYQNLYKLSTRIRYVITCTELQHPAYSSPLSNVQIILLHKTILCRFGYICKLHSLKNGYVCV